MFKIIIKRPKETFYNKWRSYQIMVDGKPFTLKNGDSLNLHPDQPVFDLSVQLDWRKHRENVALKANKTIITLNSINPLARRIFAFGHVVFILFMVNIIFFKFFLLASYFLLITYSIYVFYTLFIKNYFDIKVEHE